ncbi:MAG TPA: beta-galactosidase trimerization domain-containing protein [Capsulimonadaceae bacterium]|jgi:hypothetical protein
MATPLSLDKINDPSRNWHVSKFFGIHYDLHAGAKDTELGAALTHEHLKAELEKVKPDFIQCDCKGHPGYTSWPTEVGTPSPGIVNDALRIHRDVTREMGIPLVMHYSGVWDGRAVELHPEWACVAAPGEATGKEGFVTGGTCNLSGYTDELMIPQLIELIDKYDVDGFWVDGENWATRPCYCDRCRAEFTKRTGIGEPPVSSEDANWRTWADFHRDLFSEHVERYERAVHKRKASCLVCSNWMYTFGQPDAIKVPVDYLSGDFSWKWSLPSAMLQGRFMASRGLSWDLMAWAFSTGHETMGGWTFKHTPALCQEAAVVISLGGAFLLYDTPQRNGHLSGWHQDAIADVARFVRARQPWCEGTKSLPQAAVLHNTDHYYSHIGDHLMITGTPAQDPIHGALHSLLANHVSVDLLNETNLAARVSEYPLVVVPEQTRLSDELVATLERYVEAGGCLIATGADAVPVFGEIAGVRSASDVTEPAAIVQVARETTMVSGPWARVETVGATVVTSVLSQNDPAYNAIVMPAVTLNSYGKGRVVLIPGAVFESYGQTHYPRTRNLVGMALNALSPSLAVAMVGPASLHISLRSQPGRIIAHLVNVGSSNPLAPNASFVEDVPPTGPVTLRFFVKETPRAVYLAPSMEGLSWNSDNGVLNVAVQNVGIMDSVVVEL